MHLLENRIFNRSAIMSNEQEHAHFCHEIYYVVVNIYENPTGSFEE